MTNNSENPKSVGMLTYFFFTLIPILLVCLFFWLIVWGWNAQMEGNMHKIENYTYRNQTLSFKVPEQGATYDVILPATAKIENNSKVEVKYFVIRNTIRNISGVYINDQPVYPPDTKVMFRMVKDFN